jgi:hypothetical protein
MKRLRKRGLTLRQIADALNADGVPGPRGGAWSQTAVQRALKREGVRTTRRRTRRTNTSSVRS